MNVSGKIAVVTGAGSGIGRATALRLAAHGATVVAADIDEMTAIETVRQIGAKHGNASTLQVDTTDEASVKSMIDYAEQSLGGLDILYNNAGIITGARFPDAPAERWQRVLDINLRGVLLGTFYGIAAMKRRGGGVIIQTASAAGLAPWAADPVYAASKAGVVNFTRSLTFLEAEAKIRVNCVCPGVVRTNIGVNARGPLTQEQRAEVDQRQAKLVAEQQILDADDVARAVLELITDESLNGRAYHIRATAEWQLV